MAKQIANVNVATYTFQNWVDSTNQGLETISQAVLTAAVSSSLQDTQGTAPLYANGTSRVGYAHVNGYFSSDNLIAVGALRGGNTTVSNTLYITSSANISGALLSASANVSLTGANVSISSANVRIASGQLNLASNLTATGALNTVGGNTNFVSNTLFVDGTNNRVGIGTGAPTSSLQVNGVSTFTGNASVSQNLSVTGNTSLSNVSASGNLVSFTANVVSITGNTLNASANVSFTGANVSVVTANLAVSGGALNVGSNSRFTSNVSITAPLLSATGNINFSTGLLFVDAIATRVGINTTSPVSVLHVNGLFTSTTANITSVLSVAGNTVLTGTANLNGNTAVSNNFTVTGITTLTGNATLSGALQTISGNANFNSGVLFVDATNNRVGINNTAPNAPLTVTGAANISGLLTVSANIVSTANISAVTINATSIGTTQDVAVGRNLTVTSNTVIANLSSTGTVSHTGATTVNALTVAGILNVTNTGSHSVAGNVAFDTNVLFVDSINNRVGVGTTTPNAPLQVSGAANISGLLSVSANIVSSANISGTVVSGANLIASATVSTANVFLTGVIDHNSLVDTVVTTNTNIGANITAPQTVYAYLRNTYTAAKIIARVKNGTSFQANELLIVNDGSNAALTVYGTLNIGAIANLGVFSIVSNNTANTVDVRFQQTTTSSGVTLQATLIKA